MDKKTKLLLGVGVVGVGAYLLFKSKKATPALTSPVEPAKFVGADAFAGVLPRQIAADGGMINSLNSPTQKYSADGGFAGVESRMRLMSGGMINTTEVVGARAGSQDSGIFANKPFTGDVANLVGANGDKVFANQSGEGKFFAPRTARYGQNLEEGGVFAPEKPMPIRKNPVEPIRKSPVEPNMPVPVTQLAPLNNLVGQDGSRFFSVHDGFGK
jgi:hypothetical protein